VIGVPPIEFVVESVPHPGEQEAPPCASAQVTPLFAGSFWTVAINCRVLLSTTLVEVGETETEIAGTPIVTAKDCDADWFEESVTLILKAVAVCWTSGVPEMLTEFITELLSVRPSGNAPTLTVQPKGPAPPVARMVCRYGVPTTPLGKEVVVIASCCCWKPVEPPAPAQPVKSPEKVSPRATRVACTIPLMLPP
jgi:hypothetical protein